MGAGSRRAQSIVDELGISSVRDLRKLDLIAFERGAIVETADMQVAEARLVLGGPYSVITVAQSVGDPRRRRFGIAHELGHLELHKREAIYPCDAGSINDWPVEESHKNLEQEANEFAACLLLPDELFGTVCRDMDPSMEGITHLAEEFDVSIMATARRFVEFCYAPAAVVWTERRQIKWFQRNEAFADLGYFVNVNSMVDDNTVAAKFFDTGVVPKGSEIVRPSAWMMEGDYRILPIDEQCISMPNYEGVLSLLWVDQKWIDEEDFIDWQNLYT